MILLADSGSTKTRWSLIERETAVQTCMTKGINPFFQSKGDIVSLLEKEFTLSKNSVSIIYFYGSGCTPGKSPLVSEALDDYFRPEKIEVNSDLLAAARSLCQKEEGIACILGTGSNSCYYDGEKIVQQIPSLGYILGDEGSGAVLGKKLLGDILKKQLSPVIVEDFHTAYPFLSTAEIIERVYRQSFPNRFLAQFAPFLLDHISKPEIKQLVEDSFTEFIRRNILLYDSSMLPVHFTGSIAYHFRQNLESVCSLFHLPLGKITKDPLPGLIQYHLKYDPHH
ncbi:MAG: ATPase [Candidatus Azobacteroides sp.]|nr:ATPase [Candidatus Azobacteroides sp.]